MTILMVGQGSFIARAMARVAEEQNLPVAVVSRDAPLADIVRHGDCVINFALTPEYRTSAYQEDQDCDLRAARTASAAGAHFVMLSTRRVYGPSERWGAREDQGRAGDETFYGRNKAISEKAVLEACQGRAGIFRLSNIFGYEYYPSAPRRSFLGLLLLSLKQKNTIFFDMGPDTRRDFLPVEYCGRQILGRVQDRTEGVFNLGSGFAIRCGTLADWICEGFGGGELVCDPCLTTDEFYLDMQKWQSQFDLPLTYDILQQYCIDLGRRLKCEKS